MNKLTKNLLAALVLSTGLTLFAGNASAVAISTIDFDFTGLCDDCAFNGNPGENDPIGDGLSDAVSGVLRLTDITAVGANGGIAISSSNFHSFTYNGSSLINPFTLSTPFLITGEIDAAGNVLQDIAIGDSNDGSFDFPDFCTPVGAIVLDNVDCGAVGLVTFNLAVGGAWSIEGTLPFDIGSAGGLAPATAAPEPLTSALLGLGLVLAGWGRRAWAVRH